MDGYRHIWNKAKRRPRWLAFALAGALVTVIALNIGGTSADDNVDGAVYDWAWANPGRDVPVLVQTDGDTETVAEFIDSSGGTVQSESPVIPAVEADVSADFVSTLSDHPDVVSISLDAPVAPSGDGPAPSGDSPAPSGDSPAPSGDSPAPSLVPLQSPAVVVPPGLIAYVLGSPNSKGLAKEVGLDLQAAGIQGASLYSVDWDAIDWDAIDWDAIDWDAINWGAINWGAIDWGAIDWNAIDWNAINWNAIDWDAIDWDAIDGDAIDWVSIKWGATPEEDPVDWTDIIE